ENIEDNIEKIFEIFKVDNINDLINQFAERKFSFYRKSEKLTTDEKNLFSWSALAEYEVSKQVVNQFNDSNYTVLIDELNQAFYNNNNLLENIQVILANYGIKLAFLKKLDKTPVDGYSFWSEDNPAIVLTLRYNRVDYLAFTLFHELG